MNLPFTKLEGLGNDFVLVDARHQSFTPDPSTVRRLSDRRLGIGCDQLLMLAPPTQPSALVDYRIFNASGEEVEHCGNGVRCVARYLADRGEIAPYEPHIVNTGGRAVVVEVVPEFGVRVDMGAPIFEPALIPLDRPARAPRYEFVLADGSTLQAASVSMGNPHVVIDVDDVERAPVASIGPEMERHPAFPNRVNVGFLEVVDRGHVRLRVFERGVGETPACGTGACAAVAAGRALGLLDAEVQVSLPGGELRIDWPGEGATLKMTGPAEIVFEGTFRT